MIEDWVSSGLLEGAAQEGEAPTPAEPVLPAPGEAVTYEHVAPIFAQRCAKCHTDNVRVERLRPR